MIYFLIWTHFLADFVLQTDSMAKNKSSSNAWLGRHIAIYTATLNFILGFYLLFSGKPTFSILNFWAFCLINGAAHFATDYVTSRITKKLWAKQQVHNFFVVIGADQALHLTVLFLTAGVFLK